MIVLLWSCSFFVVLYIYFFCFIFFGVFLWFSFCFLFFFLVIVVRVTLWSWLDSRFTDYLWWLTKSNGVAPLMWPVALRWKCTFSHWLSRLCQTRVSSDWWVWAFPSLRSKEQLKFIEWIHILGFRFTYLSINCVNRTYAMQAASSPNKCTCGFRIVVLIALQFLPSTENVNAKRYYIRNSFKDFNIITIKAKKKKQKRKPWKSTPARAYHYHFRNKIYGSPFLRQDYQALLSRMLLNADHTSSYTHETRKGNPYYKKSIFSASEIILTCKLQNHHYLWLR